MPVMPYLGFTDECEAALAFYANALGAKVEQVMRYGEAPPGMPCPPENANRIMHARLVKGSEILLMASDAMEDGERANAAVSLSVTEPDLGQAKALYAALSEGGEQAMPLQDVFWGGRFGMLVDRFGMRWMVSTG